MKKRPQSALAFARELYMAARCNGAVQSMRDYDIIDTRIRAFVDGVNWAKRQAQRSARSASGG